MSEHDIRWIQRFNHYNRALERLEEAVELSRRRPLTNLEEQGLIQAFEFTHELAWNTLKDFLESRGARNLYGSRDTTREAFKRELILNGEAWMRMIQDRNLTSHTYQQDVASGIASAIMNIYFSEFQALQATMDRLRQEEQR